MGKQFNIAETFGEALKNVPNQGTGQEQLVFPALDHIEPDPRNFYSTVGIDELAANIELIGLQQPLRVRPIPDREGYYMIVSGHRRRLALLLLVKEGRAEFNHPACILDNPDESPAMQELRLIYANASTREMSSADRAKQVERVTELLYELKEQGIEFPGRMRDHVAEACKISKSKISRLKVITDKLDKPLLDEYFNKDRMSEAVAYALAQQPLDMQRRICDFYTTVSKSDLTRLHADYVTDYATMAKKLKKLKCPVGPGDTCVNQDGILEKCYDGSYSYAPCKYGHCCADCSEYVKCRFVCSRMRDKAKAAKDRQRAATKDQRAAEKAQRETAVRQIEHVWGRFGTALEAAGLTDEQLRDRLKIGASSYNEFNTYVNKEKLAQLLDFSCSDVKVTDPLPFFYSFKHDDYRRLCAVADALGCSLDYLFLRTDDPTPGAAATAAGDGAVRWPAWIPVEERLPEPDTDVLAINHGKIDRDNCDRRGTWGFGGKTTCWMPLPPMPGEEGAAVAQQDGGSAAKAQQVASAWMPGDATPDHSCDAVVEFDIGDGSTVTELVMWAGGVGGAWCLRNYSPVGMPAIRWLELPPRSGNE